MYKMSVWHIFSLLRKIVAKIDNAFKKVVRWLIFVSFSQNNFY